MFRKIIPFAVLLISGCLSVPVSDSPELPYNPKTEAYTHVASGIVFPKKVCSLERVTAYPNDPMRGAATATYGAASGTGLKRSTFSLFLNVDIEVVPDDATTTAQLLEKARKRAEQNPAFREEAYHGYTAFAGYEGSSHYSYDRPAWSDRESLKTVVIHRGHYFVTFSFGSYAPREAGWQKIVDRFILDLMNAAVPPRA
jgi:hypothetical protein